MSRLFTFIKYNNALPIALVVLFLGAGSAFAATDPGAIYSAQQQVVSVDNTYIANKDLSTYTPKIQITAVTEDADSYYVAFQFATIDLQDHVWKDVIKNQTMQVAKDDLGRYGDLGLYVTAQLRQMIDTNLAYLKDVQEKARKEVTQKTVATVYGGLIGKFLDTTTETLPGYSPVVVPPASPESQTASVVNAASSDSAPASQPASNALLSLQVLGNNPARIALHSTYSDLGAVVLDPTSPNIGYHVYLDGVRSDQPVIDTGTTSVYMVEYRAVDQAGNEVIARRVIIVGDAPDPGGEITFAGNLALSQITSAAPSPPAEETPMPLVDVSVPPPDATSTPDILPETPPAPADSTSTPQE